MTDIDGRSPKKARLSQSLDDAAVTHVDDLGETTRRATSEKHAVRRKAATDTKNPAFLEALRNRPAPTDWIASRAEENAEAAKVWEVQKAEIARKRALDKVPAT